MKSLFSSIPTRIRQKSRSFDAKAVLCSRAWDVFTDNDVRQVFIFENDGYLIVSKDGDVNKCQWSYYPQNQTLIISSELSSTMYHPSFLDDVILVLQQDGTKDALFLIDTNNTNIFPTRSLAELNSYFSKKEVARIAEEKRRIENQRKQLAEKERADREATKKREKEEEEKKIEHEKWKKQEMLRDQARPLYKNDRRLSMVVQIFCNVTTIAGYVYMFWLIENYYHWGLKALAIFCASILLLLMLVGINVFAHVSFDSYIDKQLENDNKVSTRIRRNYLVKSILPAFITIGLLLGFFLGLKVLSPWWLDILGFLLLSLFLDALALLYGVSSV